MTTLLHGSEEHSPGLVLRAALALDFMTFGEFSFGVVRPNTEFKPNWHLEALAHKLSQLAAGDIRRLIVTIPPRNLKSLFASVAMPAWYLGHNPAERVVCVSYPDALARAHANDFRQLVNYPIYQATFPAMRLARDTDREIVTTLRGKRYATSIEGTLTGLGGNLVIIDDPIKQEDARQWLTSYDEYPMLAKGDRIIMSWDIALTEEEKGDYYACVILLQRKEVFFVMEVIRGRLRFDDLRRKILEVKRRIGTATLLIEDSPISKGIIQSLEESSINVTKYSPETDKRSRLIAQSDLFAGGSVRLPKSAAWLEDFTAELLAFPGGTSRRSGRRPDPRPGLGPSDVESAGAI